MIQIRPVSDLRNKFKEIENTVNEGHPVYLTKNGYGTMVVLSLQEYSDLTDEADRQASESNKRLSHEDVFHSLRETIHAK